MKLTHLLLPVPTGEDIPWRLCKSRRLHTQSRTRRCSFPLALSVSYPVYSSPKNCSAYHISGYRNPALEAQHLECLLPG